MLVFFLLHLFMKWDKFKFVLDAFFRFRKWLEKKHVVNFGWWLESCPKKNNLQNLWNSWGVRDFPGFFRKKFPKKATENNDNNLRLRASWGRCPSSESLMMYCQAPEEGFKPFRCNLEGVLLVPQLMVNWWFGIRIAVPVRIPIPFIFGDPIGIQSTKRPKPPIYLSFWCPCKIGLWRWSNNNWAVLGLVMSF